MGRKGVESPNRTTCEVEEPEWAEVVGIKGKDNVLEDTENSLEVKKPHNRI